MYILTFRPHTSTPSLCFYTKADNGPFCLKHVAHLYQYIVRQQIQLCLIVIFINQLFKTKFNVLDESNEINLKSVSPCIVIQFK
jgi:hypothetical protein